MPLISHDDVLRIGMSDAMTYDGRERCFLSLSKWFITVFHGCFLMGDKRTYRSKVCGKIMDVGEEDEGPECCGLAGAFDDGPS